MNKKEQYEAPLVECYEIKMEKRPLMASPGDTKSNRADDGYDNNNNLGGLI